MKRQAVIIVLDGVGVGALPDAARCGGEGANSLDSLER
jgi:phosphopentomutase